MKLRPMSKEFAFETSHAESHLSLSYHVYHTRDFWYDKKNIHFNLFLTVNYYQLVRKIQE